MADDMQVDSDLRSRIVSVEHTVQGNSQRIAALETWQRQSDLADARKDEKWQSMERSIATLDDKIGRINDSLTWVVRLIIGGILMGMIAFIMKGGFG